MNLGLDRLLGYETLDNNKGKVTLDIYGKEFTLSVWYGPDLKHSSGERSTHKHKGLPWQTERLNKFLRMPPSIIGDSKKYLISYMLKNNRREIGPTVENVFKFVQPRCIFVPHYGWSEMVCIELNYKYDEDGIMLVFENSHFYRVMGFVEFWALHLNDLL